MVKYFSGLRKVETCPWNSFCVSFSDNFNRQHLALGRKWKGWVSAFRLNFGGSPDLCSIEEGHLLGLGTFQRWNTSSWCMLLYFSSELQAFEENLQLSQSWEVYGRVHMEICAVVCGAVWSVSEGHCWGKRFFASLQPSGSLKRLMTHWEWRPPPPSSSLLRFQA